MFFAKTQNVPIFEQLRLEEALFRASSENYCLAVYGSKATIVMGAFGKVEDLIDLDKWKSKRLPIIRRYSGGGTVLVDQQTLFLCWILDREDFELSHSPQELSRLIFGCLQPLFLPDRLLWIENDFCLEKEGKIYKVAGNAQAFSASRVVHHLSIPWGYCRESMSLLKLPTQKPKYRRERCHEDFLYPLREISLQPEEFIDRLEQEMKQRFGFCPLPYCSFAAEKEKPHRKTTRSETPLLLSALC